MSTSTSRIERISVLDGWRGLAILLVVGQHAGHEYFPDQAWSSLGDLGVDIFFVLSGYIITARLLEEQDTTCTISLKSFYLRRAFRILPLVLCYLSILCVISLFVNTDAKLSQIAGALFFFRNYQFAAHPGGVYTGHFWSLSIEEHFYLFWPVLLLRAGNRRALWIAVLGAYTCAIWRLFDRNHPNSLVGRTLPGSNWELRSLRTDVLLDGLLLGSALAILLTRPAVRAFIFRNFPKETPLIGAVLLMILNHPWAKGFSTLTYYSLLTLIVGSTLVVKEGLAYKWVNSRALIALGTISYSLYVWQQLFLQHPPGIRPLGALSTFPFNLIFALSAAIGSFYLLERPLIKLGHKLAAKVETVEYARV